MKDSSIRLALIFKDAGFISDVLWQKYQKRFVSEGKRLGEILTSDAFSLKTYKELLTLEIKLPFSKPREQEIQLALGQAVRLTYQEMQRMLNHYRPDADELIEIMHHNQLISDEVSTEAKEIIQRLGEGCYDALLEREIFSPEIIAGVVEKADNEYARQNRAQLALEILQYNKLLTKEETEEALQLSQDSKAPIGNVLERKGKLTEASLIELLLKGLYLPTVNLRQTTISRELVAEMPSSFIRRELFLPLQLKDSLLLSAMPDPLLLTLSDTVSLLTGKYVLPYFAPQEEVMNKIITLLGEEKKEEEREREEVEAPVYKREKPEKVVTKKREKPKPAVERPAERPIPIVALGEPQLRRIRTLVSSQSTVQLVNTLIESAIATRATDIHLEPLQEGLRVRFRIDGKLHNIMQIPRDMQLPVISRIKVLSNMDVTERRRPQDGHFGLKVEEKLFDFRISSLPTNLGEKVVLRILEKSTVLKGLAELGLDEEQQELLKSLLRKPYGMILVTGPTGSGKTTTLYSALQLLNYPERNIVTIEDPVEYQLDGINQVQVDYNIDLAFAEGLRSILRQDPDIIMVGEIRDAETARIAIRAALTGHLVFSTLHASTTVSAIGPLVQMGIAPYLISSAVIGIIAQRLVRQLCPQCKVAYSPERGVLDDLGLPHDTKEKFYKGEGCEQCLQTGYFGRTGVFEILKVDEELRHLIAERASEQKLFDVAKKKGMTSLMENGLKKIFAGITTPQEVLENIYLA